MWWTSEDFSLATDDAPELLLPVSIQAIPSLPWARKGVAYLCLSQASPILMEILDEEHNVVAATRHNERYIVVCLNAYAHAVRVSGPFVSNWSILTQR